MSENEVIHTSETGGQKAGNDERHDLIPVGPLRKLAQLYGFGVKKYAADNWRRGYDWRLSFAAMLRHAWKFWGGEDIDPESGVPHTIAVAWHAFALTDFMETHREFDTRPKAVSIVDESGVGTVIDDRPTLKTFLDEHGYDKAVVVDKFGKAWQTTYPSTPYFYPVTVVWVP